MTASMRLTNKRWKPKEGEKYWRVVMMREGFVPICSLSGFSVPPNYERALYRRGNMFSSKKVAQAVCRRLNEELKQNREYIYV